MRISRGNFSQLLHRGDNHPELVQALQRLATSASIILADTNFSSFTSTSLDPIEDTQHLDIGCISKLITSLMFFQIFGVDTKLRTETVGKILKVGCPGLSPEITIDHLLNHTSGINEPLATKHRTLPSGHVDIDGVLEPIGTNPLSPPGQLYSYSAIGMRLLAAVIEASTGRLFTSLVHEYLPGVLPDPQDRTPLCPAFGGHRVAACTLLERLVGATCNGASHDRALILDPGSVLPHPGWHPLEVGVCKGWKAYPLGWFGHVSLLPHAPSIRLLVSPSDGIGILISTTATSLWRVVSGICSEDFVASLRPPNSDSSSNVVATSQREFAGVYERVDSRLLVTARGGGLTIGVYTREAKEHLFREQPTFIARLVPVHGTIMAVAPPNPTLDMGIIEFLRDESGEISHLWCKGRVWRRLTS